ncbi:Fe-S cluster assembly protein SufD [Vulcanibacillus modesticaldus]|uniref:Fe-S cluster assembly protein SufD n=1 Tax=Vulcanibacillus modesticaldus TaxID=337097 RepID=A0A1D2YUQ8_9BACI|nr:Fe-S cluster assembly protein SufD [Vulcanibacillus modesticaldus]OEF99403.1 Fe-S cluster assembly protein SufD [Vulcanibacillus modesticaldus]
MSVTINTNFDENLVTHLSNVKKEPEWMLDIRLKALEVYKQLPIPRFEKTRIDKWNIDQFEFFIDEGDEGNQVDIPEDIRSMIDVNTENRSVIIQRNSALVHHYLPKSLGDQGVIFTTLDNALQEYPDLVKKYFMNAVKFDENKLTALHAALWNGGVFLYVPKNVEIEFPLQSVYLAEKAGLLPHVLIIAETNSNLTFVDYRFSTDHNVSYIHNGVVEVYVGEGARVRFATVHNFNKNSYDYSYRRAIVKRNGRIEWVMGEMNFGNTISNNTSLLKDSAASADIKSIFIGTGRQKADLESKVIHEGDHTESKILSRGIMLDQATAIFNGITKMEKGAVKSNAEQAENILMLSKEARGDANPILLIDEHDVMAGHAASAGPVNQNDIYYLMSRGIPKDEAERLIIHGFLASVVSRIPIEGLQEQLEKLIERKLKR